MKAASEERMKLLGTLLLGDAATAQALVQDANANLKLSHRTSFEDVKKAALKAVLQLVPMTDAKDQQARDSLEKYLLSKDRAGVVRVGMRDLYLIPPSKAEDCGLKVVPQAKCIVAAVAEKSRSKKSKSTAEVKKKAAEVVVADDTEDSEEPKNDKKVDNNRDKEDDQKNENKDGEAAVAEEKNKETKKEETTEDLKAAAPDEKKEAKPEAKQDKQDNESQASKVPHSPLKVSKPKQSRRLSRASLVSMWRMLPLKLRDHVMTDRCALSLQRTGFLEVLHHLDVLALARGRFQSHGGIRMSLHQTMVLRSVGGSGTEAPRSGGEHVEDRRPRLAVKIQIRPHSQSPDLRSRRQATSEILTLILYPRSNQLRPRRTTPLSPWMRSGKGFLPG